MDDRPAARTRPLGRQGTSLLLALILAAILLLVTLLVPRQLWAASPTPARILAESTSETQIVGSPFLISSGTGHLLGAWAKTDATGQMRLWQRRTGTEQTPWKTLPSQATSPQVFGATGPANTPLLGWSYALTNSLIINSDGGASTPTQRYELPRTADWAIEMDGRGDIHCAQAEGSTLVYRQLSRGLTITLEFANAESVRDVALAVGQDGDAYVVWSSVNEADATSTILYAHAVTGTAPVRVAAGGQPSPALGPEGTLHLSWRYKGSIYYTRIGANPRLYVVDTVVPDEKAVNLKVGRDDVAHLLWERDGSLWHACSVDWRLSKRRVAEPWIGSSLVATIDPSGRLWAAWAMDQHDAGTRLYWAEPNGVEPLLAITFPKASDRPSPSSQARAVSNMLLGDVERVAFYLEAQSCLASEPEAHLLWLGLDSDSSDGWGVPLAGTTLSPLERYRVVALASGAEIDVLQARGEWFMARTDLDADLHLSYQGPWPLRQWSTLILRGRMRGQETASLDILLIPVSCHGGASQSRAQGHIEQSATYLGSYDVRPGPDGWVSESYLFDSREIPDGCYTVVGRLGQDPQRYIMACNGEALRIENSSTPTISVRSPQPGAIIEDALEISTDIVDSDGSVTSIDAYLQPTGSREPADRLWLGSDDDGSDGWRITVPLREALDGDEWELVVSATDDRSLHSESAPVGPIQLHFYPRPEIRILRPTAGRLLFGTESVRVFATRDSDAIKGVELYWSSLEGPLEWVGAMSALDSGEGWESSWDTTACPDGACVLWAVTTYGDGYRALARSRGLTVRNHAPVTGIAEPREGAELSGWSVLRMHENASLAQDSILRAFCRTLNNEHLSLGVDDLEDGEWGIVWNTASVPDGIYTLVVETATPGAQVAVYEREVSVRNSTPILDQGSLSTPAEVAVTLPITWALASTGPAPVKLSLAYSADGGISWMPVAESLGTSGALDWDSAKYPDSAQGMLRLTVYDGDSAHHFSSEPFRLENRNQPPFVSLLSPTRGPLSGNLTTVSWRVWDPDDDALRVDVEYRLGTGDWRSVATGVSGVDRLSWDTAGLSPGDYALRVTARDRSGAVGSDAVRGLSLKSNAPPEVSVLWPSELSRVQSEAVLLWRATDRDGDPLSIDLWFSDDGGQTWLALATGLANTGYYVWQVSYLPAGKLYRVRVVARDGTSRTVADSAATFAIGSGPSADLTLHTPGKVRALRGRELILWTLRHATIGESTVTLMIRTVGSAKWQDVGTYPARDGFAIWNTSTVADGSYELRGVAREGDSLLAVSAPLQRDIKNGTNSAPMVRVPDLDTRSVWSGLRSIPWSATDIDGDPITSTLLVSVDGGGSFAPVQTLFGRTGRFFWDSRSAGPAGLCALDIEVSDGEAQALLPQPIAIAVRNGRSHPPYIDVASARSQPAPMSTALRHWSAEDPDGDVLSLELRATSDGGLTWSTLDAPMTALRDSLPPTLPPLAPLRGLRLVACDGVECASDTEFDGTLSDAESQGSFFSPIGGATWSGTNVVRWELRDRVGDVGPTVLQASRDGGQTWLDIHQSGGQQSFAWDTTSVSNGTYRLRVLVGTGSATWTLTSDSFVVRNVGRTAPTVSVLEPRGGDTWFGTRTVRWLSADADGDPVNATIAYSLDRGRSWATLGRVWSDADSYTWDTNTVPNCDDLWLRVTVDDGRFFSQAISDGPVAIRNPLAPSIRIADPSGGQALGGEQTVSWETTYRGARVPKVRIQASTDDGRTWRTIGDDQPPSGTLLWDARALSDGARVLLRALANDGITAAVDTIWEPLTTDPWRRHGAIPFFLR